jgi:ADP-heptose:LPS heptosyltransferase
MRLKVRCNYEHMFCRINGQYVEFRNYVADVPFDIAESLVKHPGYTLVSEPIKGSIIADEETVENMSGAINQLFNKIKREKKSKYLIATITIGDTYNQLAEVTHPTFKYYCNKHKIDFMNINLKDPILSPMWQRYKLSELLGIYDRIAYFDGDILIKPDAPNIFDIVPEDKIGMYNEGQYIPDIANDLILKYLAILHREDEKDKFTGEKYHNAGMVVFSKCHKNLWKIPDEEGFQFDICTTGKNLCGDQTNLNINIVDNNYEIFELKEPFVGLPNRLVSFDYLQSSIIHFALGGINDDVISNVKTIRDSFFNESHFILGANKLLIKREQGLGDVLYSTCLPRVIKKINPSIEITFATAEKFMRVAKYNPNIRKVISYSDIRPLDYDYILDLDGALLDEKNKEFFNTYDWMNTSKIDFWKKYIPEEYQNLWDLKMDFFMNKGDRATAHKIIKKLDSNKIIAISVGVTWQARNYPKNKELIEELLRKEYNVIIVGRHTSIDVNAHPRLINTIDKLGLGELGALLEKCDLLVTPDTGTLHLAGAIGVKTLSYFSTYAPKFVLSDSNYDKYHIISNPDGCPGKLWPCRLFAHNCDYNISCLNTIEVSSMISKIEEILDVRDR